MMSGGTDSMMIVELYWRLFHFPDDNRIKICPWSTHAYSEVDRLLHSKTLGGEIGCNSPSNPEKLVDQEMELFLLENN